MYGFPPHFSHRRAMHCHYLLEFQVTTHTQLRALLAGH
jgi:hypothetical protein